MSNMTARMNLRMEKKELDRHKSYADLLDMPYASYLRMLIGIGEEVYWEGRKNKKQI